MEGYNVFIEENEGALGFVRDLQGEVYLTGQKCSVVFAGQVGCGKPNGYGFLVVRGPDYLEGMHYVGQFTDGQISGWGRCFLEDEEQSGQFEDGWLVEGRVKMYDMKEEQRGRFSNGNLLEGQRVLQTGEIIQVCQEEDSDVEDGS